MKQTHCVLVLGIVLAGADNLAADIADNFASGSDWDVEQQWVAIGDMSRTHKSLPVVETIGSKEPKFAILNRILARTSCHKYDYIIVADDDIELPPSFLDKYLELVYRYDFALAQPARTHDSYIDHYFVEQLDGITARQTNFVEIGPLFSMRTDAFPLLTPFDLTSPMGWGYDFVWPVTMASANLKMGIVDTVPVRHRLRRPVANYIHADASEQMRAYLARHPHLTPEEAFVIVESFV